MKALKASFALIFLFLTDYHLAFSQVLVLGRQTALQEKVIGKQVRKRPKQTTGVNNNKVQSELEIDPAELAGVETVFLDAGQMDGANSTEMGYVRAAMDKHIPVVLENISKESMLQLAGIGLSAKVAVVEGLVHERGVRLTIVEEAANELPPGVTPVSAPIQEAEKEVRTVPMDTTKMDIKKLKAARAAIGNKPLNITQEQQTSFRPQAPANAVDIETLSTQTINALKNHAAKRLMTGKSKDERRGSLDPVVDNAIASIEPAFKRDASYYIREDAVDNLPDYAKFHIDMNWGGQRTWSIQGTSQTPRIHVDYDIWLYATTSPMNKWMIISTKGTGVSPGSMSFNSAADKGFFTERFYMQFGPYFRNGTIDRIQPQNANDQTNIATSTGFSIGASAGADASGPNASLNASYSSSTTVSSNIDDFRVTNNSDAQYAKFTYALSSTSGGAYNNWGDLMNPEPCFFCNPVVHTPPVWATNGFLPSCESVWVYPKDYNAKELLYFYQHQYLRRVRVSQINFWSGHSYAAQSVNYRYDQFPSVDFSRVQLPHLGLGAKVTQSSTEFNGHASRAVDGNVDGNYTSNSVTHTDIREGTNPYWEIDLGENRANKVINRLDIWNRTDCCGDRLQDAVIFVSDVPFTSTDLDATFAQVSNSRGSITQLTMSSFQEIDGRRRSIPLGRIGRFIRIQRRTGILSLAEVQVIPQGF